MVLVGLTGSIASGKTLLASFLAEKGATVIDADQIGHEVLKKGGPVYAQVVQAFGPGILDAKNEIDRKVLGAIVFADETARRRLNDIVHPPLLAELSRRLREVAGDPVAVVDAALLYEFGAADSFDVVIVVRSTESRQIERLQARGLSEGEARQRIAAQWTSAEKARRADFVVDNDGRPEDLAREAERLWRQIIKMIPGRPPEALGPPKHESAGGETRKDPTK